MKKVSIPHRYGKNKNWDVEGAIVLLSFPFLIGTVRTLLPSDTPFDCLRVSIPHRYGKN